MVQDTPSFRQERRKRISELRQRGYTTRQIAQTFARDYNESPLKAFRWAYDWTLAEAAGHFNNDVADDPEHEALISQRLSEYENWPRNANSTPPRLSLLQEFAKLYQCPPADLLEGDDYTPESEQQQYDLTAAPTASLLGSAREAGSRRPTLLQVLVRRRHWQTYETFVIQYERAAKELAERDQDPRLRALSITRRQFERWLAGSLKTTPYPSACRVLEYLFGCPADELLSPTPSESTRAAREQIEAVAPAAPVAPGVDGASAAGPAGGTWPVGDAVPGEAVVAARKHAGRELARLRHAAGLNQHQLASRVGYSRGQIAGAEAGTNSTAPEFWQACDRALGADGVLIAARDRIEAALETRRDAAARREQVKREARLQQGRAERLLPDAEAVAAVALGVAPPDSNTVGLEEHAALLANGMVLVVGERGILRGMHAGLADAEALLGGLQARVGYPFGVTSGVGLSQVPLVGDGDDHMNRRAAVLYSLTLLGAPVVAALTGDLSDGETIEVLRRVTARYRQRTVTGDTQGAYLGLLRHADAVKRRADQASAPFRNGLLAIYAEALGVAGNIAFFDLGQHEAARKHLDRASSLAAELAEAELLVWLRSRQAHRALYDHAPTDATRLAGVGRRAATEAPHSPAVGELLLAEAEAAAHAGEQTRALRALEQAEFYATTRTAAPGARFASVDVARREHYRGIVLMHTGNLDAAEPAISASLAVLPAWSGGRSLRIADLAEVQAARGEVEHAATLATEALAIGIHTGSVEQRRRVLRPWSRLKTHQSVPAVRDLGEQVRAAGLVA